MRPSSFEPNYDNPVLLATLSINSPTFTRGGSINFFGATEKVYIGHDMGMTSINFDGSGEAFVGSMGSWTQTVPRQAKDFIGKLYVGNGSNIAEIDSTGTVTTYTKLSPGFPTNTQVRDLDQSNDGNYLQAVVTRLALPDITSPTQDTTLASNQESYVFKWNGVDTSYTSFDSFPSFSLNANIMFGDWQYTFGYDVAGSCVFNPIKKILTPILTQAPLPNAVGSNGNIVGWGGTEFYNGFLRAVFFLYGALDEAFSERSWYRQLAQVAQGGEVDVIRMPFNLIVSNFLLGSVLNGYVGGVAGAAKQYFSTLETSPGTTKYKLYKFFNVALGYSTSIGGIYETQQVDSFKLFRSIIKSKFKPSELRFYCEPFVAGNSFQVDLIGSNLGTKTFTAGTDMPVGQDYVWYNPAIAPTHSIGIRITNLGTTNWVCNKIEMDYDEAGD